MGLRSRKTIEAIRAFNSKPLSSITNVHNTDKVVHNITNTPSSSKNSTLLSATHVIDKQSSGTRAYPDICNIDKENVGTSSLSGHENNHVFHSTKDKHVNTSVNVVRTTTTSPRKTAVAFRNRVPGGLRGGGSNHDQGYTEPSRTDADEPPLLDDDEEADFWFNKICQRDSLAQPNAPPSVEQVFDHQFSPESEKVDSCMPSQFAASEDFGTWETEATDDPDADDVFLDGAARGRNYGGNFEIPTV